MNDSEPCLPVEFRPRTVRIWAYAIGTVAVVACVVVALILPAANSDWVDRLGFLLFGLVIFWFCHRQASVRIRATTQQVIIRGLFTTRIYEWPELFAVRFRVGDPWAHLDLSNGDTISLMALQRADGDRGLAQARAFNALIQHYGTAANDLPD